MGNNTFNIKNVGQIINQPQAGVSITHNNYAENEEIEAKLDEMLSNFDNRFAEVISKQDETKASIEETISSLNTEQQTLLNEIMRFIQIGFNELNEEEQRRFEELKQKPDWENTLELYVPFIDKLGIKIATKTKLENLPKKICDQITLLTEKRDTWLGINTKDKSLEANKVKDELKE